MYIFRYVCVYIYIFPLFQFFVGPTWFQIFLHLLNIARHPVSPSEATPFAHVGRRRKTNISHGKELRVSQALRKWGKHG